MTRCRTAARPRACSPCTIPTTRRKSQTGGVDEGLCRAVAALLLSGCANNAPSEMAVAVPSEPIVLCYDSRQDVVTRLPASDCKGRVITGEEADALAAARTKRVRSQIAGANRGRPGEKVEI